jgi:hypothetical protein
MTKKLIEVALPLQAINQAAARERSIRHSHPSTLPFIPGSFNPVKLCSRRTTRNNSITNEKRHPVVTFFNASNLFQHYVPSRLALLLLLLLLGLFVPLLLLLLLFVSHLYPLSM